MNSRSILGPRRYSMKLKAVFPVACIGGKKELMQLVTHREVFHGGVYSGNPLAMACVLAVQKHIEQNHRDIYSRLEENAQTLISGLQFIFEHRRIPVIIQNVRSLISLRFVQSPDVPIENYRDVVTLADPARFINFNTNCRKTGYMYKRTISSLGFYP